MYDTIQLHRNEILEQIELEIRRVIHLTWGQPLSYEEIVQRYELDMHLNTPFAPHTTYYLKDKDRNTKILLGAW